ncbi:hypothetical protein E2C01_003933 [Portunus trituberculatus]|uniref:Uncharacterized protein n=1 Tax=Portunus trituberculatus TaxID=210409 RepID=A0A5B7CP65_PORTR|nr:hypothetical protein [Portunus trituberculatus]
MVRGRWLAESREQAVCSVLGGGSCGGGESRSSECTKPRRPLTPPSSPRHAPAPVPATSSRCRKVPIIPLVLHPTTLTRGAARSLCRVGSAQDKPLMRLDNGHHLVTKPIRDDKTVDYAVWPRPASGEVVFRESVGRQDPCTPRSPSAQVLARCHACGISSSSDGQCVGGGGVGNGGGARASLPVLHCSACWVATRQGQDSLVMLLHGNTRSPLLAQGTVAATHSVKWCPSEM